MLQKNSSKKGGHLKNDVIIKGGSKIMTHDDKGKLYVRLVK